ncbi:hypothetical protein GCM10023084_02640 [Streptomyces lacrimifluminis]|uniref:hypothetical protein n=1 Tax=Streptomyces lacrimifluminis TaxID=1500077 RepID=UPI0031E80085
MSIRTLPPHGSLSRARAHHCPCPPCARRTAEYHQTRRRLIAYGQWQPYVDAEPVRQHVHMLRTYSLGVPRVRQLSGVSGGSMTKLLYGANGRPPSQRVRTLTADRVTAVRPSLDLVLPTALVDGTGTRRRLRALTVMGWPQREIGRRLGVDRKTVNEQVNAVKATTYGSTARAVRDLYDRLWDADPVVLGVDPRWIAESKASAAKRRWAPPAAWDDDYIDSPAAVPDLGEKVSAYAALSENALWLMNEQGYTREQAAHRLGITGRHLERALTWARDAREAVAS